MEDEVDVDVDRFDHGTEMEDISSAERVVEVEGDLDRFDHGRETADMFSAE